MKGNGEARLKADQRQVLSELEVKSHFVLGNSLVMLGFILAALTELIGYPLVGDLALFIGIPVTFVLGLCGALLVVYSVNIPYH